MKTTIIALFCLLACGTAYGKHGHARNHPLLSRAATDKCSLKCDVTVNATVNANWNIVIESSGPNKVAIDVAYDVERNIIVSIHHQRKWGLYINGNTGYIAWFESNYGGVTFVNVKAGTAAFFLSEDVRFVEVDGKIDIKASITKIVGAIESKTSLTFNIDVKAYFNDLHKNPDADVIQYIPENDRDAYKKSFELHLSITRENIRTKRFTVELGIYGFALPNFYGAEEFGQAFLTVFSISYPKTDGKFDRNFALAIYNTVTVDTSNADAGNIFVFLSYNIQAIGTVYDSFNDAIAAYNRGEVITSFSQYTIGSIKLTHVKYRSGNWAVCFGRINSENSVNNEVLIVYYKSSKAFLFYNFNEKIAVFVSGEYKLFAVWNVKTGGGLIVKYTGAVVVVGSQQNIVVQFSAGRYDEGASLIQAQIKSKHNAIATFNYVTFVAKNKIVSFDLAISTLSAEDRAVVSGFKSYFEISIKSSITVTGLIGGVFSSTDKNIASGFVLVFGAIGFIGGEFDDRFVGSFELTITAKTGVDFKELNGLADSIKSKVGASGSAGFTIS